MSNYSRDARILLAQKYRKTVFSIQNTGFFKDK